MSMDADGCPSSWLLLLTQLPGSPSSPRVALWRRLRAARAATMVSSVWVLPETAAHAELLAQLRDGLFRQGGIGFVLSTSPASPPDVDEAIVSRFRAGRGLEYDEFAERCAALLDELGREGKAGKYTFAEMEESDQDLEKLAAGWRRSRPVTSSPTSGGRRRRHCWRGARPRSRPSRRRFTRPRR